MVRKQSVAKTLGYTCVSQEVIVDASQLLQIPKGKLSKFIHDASEIICMVATGDTFKATPQSKKDIRNMALCSHVKAALQDICDAEVTANEGIVHVTAKGQRLKKSGFASPALKNQVGETIREDLSKDILRIVRKIPDVKDIVCDIDLPYYY